MVSPPSEPRITITGSNRLVRPASDLRGPLGVAPFKDLHITSTVVKRDGSALSGGGRGWGLGVLHHTAPVEHVNHMMAQPQYLRPVHHPLMIHTLNAHTQGAAPPAATVVIVVCIAALVVIVVVGIYRIHATQQQDAQAANEEVKGGEEEAEEEEQEEEEEEEEETGAATSAESDDSEQDDDEEEEEEEEREAQAERNNRRKIEWDSSSVRY
ncbi:hypothetical protein CRUP_020189 [Coryphaenoides rupestris]|nr:hypothetical protein CRUP_020189 [Coryphaenoides rupestris]